MQWIAHLDLDAFFASCERYRRGLEGPVVVCVYTRDGSSGAVSTSGYEARKLGIGSGMPLSEARRKAGDETVFLPVDHGYYRQKSGEVMEVLRSSSSQVQRYSIDEAFFRLENRPREKAERIKSEIDGLGLSASIGIASNRFVAKMASEHDKPDGLTVVEDGKKFLSNKQAGDLHGVGPKTREKLVSNGIETVKDIREANNSWLAEKLGRKKAASLKTKANGEGDGKLVEEERKQMSKVVTMKENSSKHGYIKKELSRACALLYRRVKRRNVAFSCVGITVIDTDLETHTRSRKIKTSKSSEKLFEEAFSLLRDFGKKVEVRRIGVRVSGLVDVDKQTSLTNF